jgi:hypothetical protein
MDKYHARRWKETRFWISLAYFLAHIIVINIGIMISHMQHQRRLVHFRYLFTTESMAHSEEENERAR